MFPFSSPFSFQPLWTLTRTTKNRKTTASRDHDMDTLMLISLSVAVMTKWRLIIRFSNWFGMFRPNCFILLIWSRFGYNSEKQFNNSLFLKAFEPREMATVNNHKTFNISPGGTMPKPTACRSPFFGLNVTVFEGESCGCFDKSC
jgi:hypothetical protein